VPTHSWRQLRIKARLVFIAILRETISVILTSLSRHKQVVLDRMSAAIGHDVEEPLRSINDDVIGHRRRTPTASQRCPG
jgi:hypothetical protein